MLQNKNALIYGAGGSIGSAVARAFAAAGATVFLTGPNLASIQKVVDTILASGGKANAAQVDAMDEEAVFNHLTKVIQQVGTVDISFNLIDLQVVQNIPLVNIAVADFVRPVAIAMQSHFITAKTSARVMMKQGSGVILSLTATPGGIGYPFTGGFGPACSALESFSRNLAAEQGIYGVRVVNIRSGGSPDSKVFADAIAARPDEMKVVLDKMENDTMLKKMPLISDITNLAIFLASDLAGAITGVTVDVTGGTTSGLNYRTMDGRF
ncbi:MAG: SDR family NAD(P)-dependent oxidoreductase [Chitinophagaceae bacterium]